jgi:hypothetical protein
MTSYHEGYPTVQDQIRQIQEDMIRRKRELEVDKSASFVVENRIVTEKFAQIQGLKNHLTKARQAKASYNNQEVMDQFGHGSVTRGQLHRRNQTKY